MPYIWEDYSLSTEFSVESKLSPYIEVESGNRVNPLLRFAQIFDELYPLRKQEGFSADNYKAIGNLLLHCLAQLDLISGIDATLIKMNYFEEKILCGYFGQKASELWMQLKDERSKLVILHTLAKRVENGKTGSWFMAAIQRLLLDASLVYEKSSDTYYLYTTEKQTNKNNTVIELAKFFFWNIGQKMECVWEKHYGIIGEDCTMVISAISIL